MEIRKPYDLRTGLLEEVLKDFDPETFDSCVTDGPYGISMMGREWDTFKRDYRPDKWSGYDAGHKNYNAMVTGKYNLSYEAMLRFQEQFYYWAQEIYRVLKPGAYVVNFCAPRTYHRMVCAFEDAGFEVRHELLWIFGNGFPKSMNISKAIDKAAGAERQVIGRRKHPTLKDPDKMIRSASTQHHGSNQTADEWDITAPATEMAKKWDGWGTALKQSHESIMLARKPFDGTVTQNVTRYGTGALNIDACRIPFTSENDYEASRFGSQTDIRGGNYNTSKPSDGKVFQKDVQGNPLGRWPSDVIHDGSPEVLWEFPYTKSGQDNFNNKTADPGYHGNTYGNHSKEKGGLNVAYGDEGSAARFFYCPKISTEDRNEGMPDGLVNDFPTVKPTNLMRWLCRLVTPIDGLILDPFAGSGSTGKAAMYEMMNFVGIDKDPKNLPIQEARIQFALRNRTGQYGIFLTLNPTPQ